MSLRLATDNISNQYGNNRYNAEIVAGALVPFESRALAPLYLRGVSEKELKYLLTVENILQKRSPGTAIREAELIKKRFNLIEDDLLQIIAHGTRQPMMQALLIAAIKHSNLIGDFLLKVVKDKWRNFETILKVSDWENFLRECEQIDLTVGQWKTTTRGKLGQVVKKCLVEAGYLESARKPVITPVLLMPEIKKYLIDNKEGYVLECMEFLA